MNDNIDSKDELKRKSKPNWLLSHFMVFVFGLLASWLYSFYSDYNNRPILDVYPKEIVISKEMAGNWVLKLDANFVNSGNTAGIIELNSLKVLFPSYSDQYYIMKVNKILKINGRSSLEKKFTLTFPDIFDSIIKNYAPILESTVIEIINLKNSEMIFFKKDSSDILMSAGYSFLKDGIPDSSYTVKELKPEKGHILKFQTVDILYKGKTYRNYAFPPDEIIEPKIKNDKIYIFHANPPSQPVSGSSALGIPIFKFIPHKELKDKIVIEEQKYLTLQIQNEKNEFREYKLSIKSKRKSFVYLFKQH